MKIETRNSTDNSIKAKIEKILKKEDGTMFSNMLAYDSGYTGFIDFSNDFINDSSTENLISSITDFNSKDMKSSYKYDCMSIDRDDAMFFANAVKNGNCGFVVNGQVLTSHLASSAKDVGTIYKSAEVSKTLINMIENAQSTQKPVRIDFGNDISAIIRVSSDGKISAQFLPTNEAAEDFLRSNITYLQQAFEEQEIPYNDLSFRPKQQQQKQQNQQNQNQNGYKQYQEANDEGEY